MRPNALTQIEKVCRTLNGQDRYLVDGATIDGMPEERYDIDALACHLGRRDTTAIVRDAIWCHIIDLARGPDQNWSLIAVRLAMPGIRRAITRARHILPTYGRGELETEAVCVFTEALHTIDADQSNLCSKLCQRVSSAVRAFLRAQLRDIKTAAKIAFESHLPPQPFGHMDLVLREAVDDGIIDEYEAELIGSIRIDKIDLKQIADDMGVSRIELSLAIKVAEERLVHWIFEKD